MASTATWNPTPEGETKAKRRHPWMYGTPHPSLPSSKLPKVQQEPGEEWAARIGKALEKSASFHRYQRYVGRAVPGGYRIVATDGYMALLEWGEGSSAPLLGLRVPPDQAFTAAITPEVQAMIGRVVQVGGRTVSWNALGRVNLGISGDFQRWLLQSWDIDLPGFLASEWQPLAPHDQVLPAIWEGSVVGRHLRVAAGEKTIEGAELRYAPGAKVIEIGSRRLVRGPIVVLVVSELLAVSEWEHWKVQP